MKISPIQKAFAAFLASLTLLELVNAYGITGA